jgi:hypothetical protein
MTMRKVILQIGLEPAEASVTQVRQKLSLRPEQIDPDFGVRKLRPDQNQYAVRVDADVAQAIRGESTKQPSGGRVSVALVH